MNNDSVKTLLDDCDTELAKLESIVVNLGLTSSIVPYLGKYGLIKACGAIEQAYKSIVADKCSYRARQQVKNYLTDKVRNSSSNPSLENIYRLLKAFDPSWKDALKNFVKNHGRTTALKTSIQSLVDARNEFAHGGNPHVSISDVRNYFGDARVIIEELDRLVG